MKMADVTAQDVTTVIGGHVEKRGLAVLTSLVEHAIVWPPEG